MTWLPWLGAMVLALAIFAGNGIYQHRSWWVKGGRETHYVDVDILTQMPAGPAAHHHLGDHFEVRAVWGLICLRCSCRLTSSRHK